MVVSARAAARPREGSILAPVDSLTFTLVVCGASLVAGLFGALTGLGGGGILTPILVLALGVDIRYAIGASLVAVIATSCGSAGAFLREGFVNVRVALLLEVATVLGAIGGAILAAHVPVGALGGLFGVVMIWTAWHSRRTPEPTPGDTVPDPLADRLRLGSTFPGPGGRRAYSVHRVPAGFGVMLGAGVLSALIGIGSGVFKVLAMDRLMRMPFKVSTTTSNFMIGVTAAASVAVYLHRGQVHAGLAMPVAVGALAGSALGARLLKRFNVATLRIIFAVVLSIVGVQMIVRGVRAL
ncbi:MAG: sulfite exporter TauE/SafE family protein [Phycisphaerales bacterium]